MDLGRADRMDRLEALAAEYALGTLSARVRRRFAAHARQDAKVAAVLRAWEHRLAGLAEGIPEVTPAPRVWEGIRTRLGMNAEPATAGGWWQSLGLWRGLAATGFALAVAVGVALTVLSPSDQGEALVVVLAGQDARPALVASANRGSRTLLVKTVGAAPVPPGRTLELWALPEGGNPASLGVLPADSVVRVTLPATAESAFRNVPALAVSLEPTGGSPTGLPTGPVLYSGPIQRFY
ncbi:MAG: anti-sigma factor [Casimicrobiaceae bacterium]